MSQNVSNQVAFLRTTRNFPTDDPIQLSVEVNRSYVDIANAVNTRTIGIFPKNVPAQGGETWYLTSQRQQNFRQIFTFTTAPTTINHNLSSDNVSQFTKCSGAFTDGTNWYGVIFGSNVAIAGQYSFYITSTQIVILVGAGAPPVTANTTGTIVLEWISKI